ncbi:MAG: leucine-rich repeat protein [Roseburia sp.]|nr:leucine-rich repeat protein [Roseburia sp.]MCM1278567.1 leucine-rich repeat protein [Robinsoniella sp.]
MQQKIKSPKSKVISILFGVLLCLCAMPKTVKAETACNVACPSFSFTDTDGNTVTNESLKGKTTILMFSTDYCSYFKAMINGIGKSDWFPNENINIVLGLLNGTEDSTKEFKSNYGYEGIRFCYGSSMSPIAFECYYRTGGTGSEVATPLFFLLDPDGNIRYSSEGYLNTDKIADMVDDYANLDYSINGENINIFLLDENTMIYTGKAQTPRVVVKKEWYQLILTEGNHYTVSYENNINAGTGYAVVTGMGYMKGSKRISFIIQPKSISNLYVDDIQDQDYTGQPLRPQIILMDNYTTLQEEVDYTLSYFNNINAGTATIQITGMGNYTGNKTVAFQILKKESPQNNTPMPEAKGTKITDADTAGNYVVTDSDADNPTVTYVSTTNKKKKSVSVPEYVSYKNVKYKVTSVSAKSFKGNKKLTTIRIASNVTKIGDSIFEGCTSLKSVTIGKGLKTIGKNAFKNCKKLKKITIKSTKLKSVGKNAFKDISAKCKIKVPAKKVKAYTKLMKKKGQKPTVKISK